MRKFRTKQARSRERVKVALKGVGVLILLALLLCGVAYATHHPALRIQTVHISTDGSLSEDVLRESVTRQFEKRILGIFPGDSFFLVRMTTLEQSLEDSFPRILNVSVRHAGLQELSVSVRERSPHALWCGDVVPPVAHEYRLTNETESEEKWGTCYLMDESANIYAKAPIYTGDVFLRYYGALDQANPVGQQFIAAEEFERWQGFYTNTRDDQHSLKAILFVDERDLELYLRGALRVLATRSEDIELTRRHLRATFTSGVLDETRSVEYLDLRFGSKAYVKYVHEESEG